MSNAVNNIERTWEELLPHPLMRNSSLSEQRRYCYETNGKNVKLYIKIKRSANNQLTTNKICKVFQTYISIKTFKFLLSGNIVIL